MFENYWLVGYFVYCFFGYGEVIVDQIEFGVVFLIVVSGEDDFVWMCDDDLVFVYVQ